MIGHQSTNLLSSIDLYNVANDVRFPREQEIVQEAVRNLREEFTWIGLTDRIEESINSMRAVFPFLAENLNEYSMVVRNMFTDQGKHLMMVEGLHCQRIMLMKRGVSSSTGMLEECLLAEQRRWMRRQ